MGSSTGTAETNDIAASLSRVLTKAYALYVKTHNFQWNVVGPRFQSLHALFEQQYNQLWLSVDRIAERLRALGLSSPPGAQSTEGVGSEPRESDVHALTPTLRDLVEGHESIALAARDALDVATVLNDKRTYDVLAERMQVHERTAGILRCLLD